MRRWEKMDRRVCYALLRTAIDGDAALVGADHARRTISVAEALARPLS